MTALPLGHLSTTTATVVARSGRWSAQDRQLQTMTRREREVLAALMQGMSLREIATGDGVSVETVRTQVSAVLRKLGVHSQVAAVAKAWSCGWRVTETSFD
jgi:DNA-binding CsgD family transcriptional regulator